MWTPLAKKRKSVKQAPKRQNVLCPERPEKSVQILNTDVGEEKLWKKNSKRSLLSSFNSSSHCSTSSTSPIEIDNVQLLTVHSSSTLEIKPTVADGFAASRSLAEWASTSLFTDDDALSSTCSLLDRTDRSACRDITSYMNRMHPGVEIMSPLGEFTKPKPKNRRGVKRTCVLQDQNVHPYHQGEGYDVELGSPKAKQGRKFDLLPSRLLDKTPTSTTATCKPTPSCVPISITSSIFDSPEPLAFNCQIVPNAPLASPGISCLQRSHKPLSQTPSKVLENNGLNDSDNVCLESQDSGITSDGFRSPLEPFKDILTPDMMDSGPLSFSPGHDLEADDNLAEILKLPVVIGEHVVDTPADAHVKLEPLIPESPEYLVPDAEVKLEPGVLERPEYSVPVTVVPSTCAVWSGGVWHQGAKVIRASRKRNLTPLFDAIAASDKKPRQLCEELGLRSPFPEFSDGFMQDLGIIGHLNADGSPAADKVSESPVNLRPVDWSDVELGVAPLPGNHLPEEIMDSHYPWRLETHTQDKAAHTVTLQHDAVTDSQSDDAGTTLLKN